MRNYNNTGMNPIQIRMGAPRRGGAGADTEGELMVADPMTKPKRPPMYKVVLLNDDYTPMDFVVLILESIFHKEHADALEIMLQIHNKGAAAVGVYTRDVAETKAGQVVEHARINEYPLQCTVEKE
jgi:ATP-dependent Clp protease adaptor protein ClpS